MNRMRRNIIPLVAAIAVLIGFLIYNSPDDSHPRENIQDAIKLGRTYAYNLLISDKNRLSQMSFGQAKDKIDKANLQSPLFTRATIEERSKIYRRLMEEEKMPYNFVSPLTPILFAEKENEVDLELMLFERCEVFAVMTFAYKSLESIVEIPEKGKMLFSIATRYYNPEDIRLFGKLIRKVANLPLLNKIIGRFGTTGKWVVFDYNYKYNLNDYLQWITGEGQDRFAESKRSDDLISKLKNRQDWERFWKSTSERTGRKLAFLYEWGSDQVERQIELIEELDKAKKKYGEK